MTDQAREEIMARIKQSLRVPSPRPHWLDAPIEEGPLFPLPELAEGPLRQRFRQEFEAIQGEWIEPAPGVSGSEALRLWLEANHIRSVLAVDCPLVRDLVTEEKNVTWTTAGASAQNWEAFEVGITPCESLVAESGTIAVSAGISGRAPSILPPIHLVVATADQLVADLDTSIARLRQRYGRNLPSTMSWISGPSRTADIEKILVLGAHGPRRLALLVLPAKK